MAKLGGEKNITVRFATARLKKQDEAIFKELAGILAPDAVLTCEVGMANFIDGAANLIDEVDHFILDCPSFNIDDDAVVIGFTATPLKAAAKSNEKRLMELMGF